MSVRKKIAAKTKLSAVKVADREINASFSENALKMMRKRYLVKDERGNQETPAEMFHRIAAATAGVEAKYGTSKRELLKIEKDFFDVMTRKEFTPAGRTITNAGGETRVVANCIVLPVLDSMESIFQTLKDAALLQQAGAGLGFDFSHLRPAFTPTKTSKGVSSGPVSFLKVYNETFGVIKQQCFAKGTPVVTKRGLIPIEEIHRGDETFTHEGWRRVTEVFANGVRETVRLTLDSGFSIELTPEHKVAVVTPHGIALKQVKDLDRSDTLLMKLGGERPDAPPVALAPVAYQKSKYTSSQLTAIRQPHTLDTDFAYFLGWYFADGWNDAQGIGLVLPLDPAVTAYAVELVEKLFGVRPLLSRNGTEQCQRLKINSVWVKKYLAENDLLKQHSPKLVFPKKILVSPSPVQRAFIAGFFDGDGDNGKNYRINSTSRAFIAALQLVLLTNGIASKVRGERKVGTAWKTVYRLSIIGKAFTHAFYEAMREYSWKIQEKEKTKDFGWIFPFHPVRDLGYAYQSIRRIHDGVRQAVSYAALQSIQLIARPCADVPREQSSTLLGFVPVHVARIVPSGKREVYDFEVEGVHMINAGIYTSNSRHGANMAMMRVDHPDVLDFIRCKAKEGDIRNFNISVQLTDEFMQALQERPDTQWFAAWNGKKIKPHKVLRAPNDSVTGFEELTVTVKEIMDEIVEHAWRNGEPGVAFIDTVNRTNPLPGLGPIDCTNPCGEQALHHYDVCNLGSINLAPFVRPLAATVKGKKSEKLLDRIDWKRLDSATKIATRMLDNVIDLFDYPVEKVDQMAKKNRRVGLGIMGFADMLYQMGVPYNSSKGLAVAEAVMKRINETAHATSRALAKEKGIFPNYPLSVFAKNRVKMRNAALTTVAPTGSISMMFDCSSGIEPNFALAYVKQDKDGHQYHYLNRHFESELKRRGLYSEKLVKEVTQKGTIQHLAHLPQDLRDTFVVSMDLSGEDHIRMQAAFQNHVDNSISKTINFPGSATREDVMKGYILGWQLGCKSTTVYRDGSRVIQILNIGDGKNIVAPTEAPVAKKVNPAPLVIPTDRGKIEPRVRSEVVSGRTYRVKTGYGNLYVTINDDETGAPFEVFATIGKSGGFFQEQSEGICRLISLTLRSGIKVEAVIEQLKGIRGPMPVMTDKGTILSLPDALGQILLEHARANGKHRVHAAPPSAEGGAAAPTAADLLAISTDAERAAAVHMGFEPKMAIADFGMMPGCPDCGSPLKLAEGCMSCPTCGFSRCT